MLQIKYMFGYSIVHMNKILCNIQTLKHSNIQAIKQQTTNKEQQTINVLPLQYQESAPYFEGIDPVQVLNESVLPHPFL